MRPIKHMPGADLDRLRVQIGNAAGQIKTFTGGVNNAALYYMQDADEHLRRHPRYRQKVKMLHKQVHDTIRKYEDGLLYPAEGSFRMFDLNDMHGVSRDKYKADATNEDYFEFWKATGGNMYAITLPHINALEWKYERLLTRHGIKEPKAIAMCMVVSTLLDMAQHTYKSIITELQKEMNTMLTPVDNVFNVLNIEPVTRAYVRFIQELIPEETEMTEHEERDISTAISSIASIWSDPLVYTRIQRDAIVDYDKDIFASRKIVRDLTDYIDNNNKELKKMHDEQLLQELTETRLC